MRCRVPVSPLICRLFTASIRAAALACAAVIPPVAGAETVQTATAVQESAAGPAMGGCFDGPTGFWQVAKNTPDNIVSLGKAFVKRENLPLMGAIIVSTGVLIAYDGLLYEETMELGTRLGIKQFERKAVILRVHVPVLDRDVGLFSFPKSLGTAMYFLGDGWLHIGIMGGYFCYGWLADSCRATKTAWDLAEGMVATGTTILAIKMMTGREDPNVRTKPNGKWQFFPSPREYLEHVTHYDAYPSGHLATAMCTVTVISTNYPEYWWIKALGYGLMVPLAFQMVNNGVHWYSDYPLALFIGYTIGKTVTKRRNIRAQRAGSLVPDLAPIAMGDGGGVVAKWRF